MQLNQRTFHNLQSHLACWHTKMFTLIRHTICESLVKISVYFQQYQINLTNFTYSGFEKQSINHLKVNYRPKTVNKSLKVRQSDKKQLIKFQPSSLAQHFTTHLQTYFCRKKHEKEMLKFHCNEKDEVRYQRQLIFYSFRAGPVNFRQNNNNLTSKIIRFGLKDGSVLHYLPARFVYAISKILPMISSKQQST